MAINTQRYVGQAPDAALDRLPVLDLRVLDEPDGGERFRRDLLAATRDVGFFYLVGHGVDRARQQRLLAAARDFFALPEAEKRSIENLNSPHFRGWTRLGGELTQGRQDWREQIDIGTERAAVPASADAPWNVLEGPNQWPPSLPQFRTIIEEWTATLRGVGLTLARQWALALGQPEDTFDAAFAQRPSTLVKVVHYPARPAETAGTRDDAEPRHQAGAGHDAEPGQGVGAHKDSGFLTLLFVEPGKGGLQVEHDGAWLDAPPLDDAFIVNIGELLEVATDGLLKSTVHRVVSPPPGQDRVSVPFFFNPALDARIPRLSLPPELAAQATGVTQDAANVLHDTYGANALKSRLRAHPDVAARHHPELVATPA